SEERRVDSTHQRSSGTREFESGLLFSKRLNFSSSEERRGESTHQTSPEERSAEAICFGTVSAKKR
ncbi:hypothetical protein AVEN_22621-1, partial [Araneus ventricosus]